MKNRNILIIVFLLISCTYITAQNSDFRIVENKAFKTGEKLTFDVKYGFVTAGIAEMSIPKTSRISGREVYNVQIKVNTVPSFDFFFKVRDRYETYLDTKGLFPWRFVQHIREGNYSRDFSAFFDHRRGIAKTSEGSHEIPKYVNDIVSAFYFARTINYTGMKAGDRISLENFYKDRVFPLDVVFRGRETISVDNGTFDCIIIEPLVVEGGLFKNEGSIIVWLTDDELKIPLKVKTKVIIGSIDIELTAYEGLAGEPTSKK